MVSNIKFLNAFLPIIISSLTHFGVGFSVDRNFGGNHFQSSRGHELKAWSRLDNSNIGLRLYAPGQEQPTCVNHGFIFDTRIHGKRLSQGIIRNSEDWMNRALEQHNRQRVEHGYLPIQLSENLNRISSAYSKLLGVPSSLGHEELDLTVSPKFEGNKRLFDLQYEDTYYNEKLRFQAPDLNPGETSIRACCPAPFMRMLSNETKEIGLSRQVYHVIGNFKRLIFLAVFYPKSNLWTETGLCDLDEETFGKAMHDSSEYTTDEDDAKIDNIETNIKQKMNKVAEEIEKKFEKATNVEEQIF